MVKSGFLALLKIIAIFVTQKRRDMKDLTVAREIKTNFKNHKEGSRIYAVMLFDTELNLGIPFARPNTWENYSNAYFTDGFTALEYYSNTPCPASQLIDANSPEELEEKMNQMINQFKDTKWLETELYPCL